MNPRFFEQPNLNSPYEAPWRHWELDDNGQPTHRIVEAEVASGGMAKHEGQADLGPVVACIRTGDAPLRRDEALGVLRAHKATIVERFDVVRHTLFGSVARDQAEPDSDLDLLVEFRGEKSRSKSYFGLMFYFEDLLEREIDLVAEESLRREFRPYVEGEAIRV